jgi:hypothetical protein
LVPSYEGQPICSGCIAEVNRLRQASTFAGDRARLGLLAHDRLRRPGGVAVRRLRALWWRWRHAPFDWQVECPEWRDRSHIAHIEPVRVTRYPERSQLKGRA